MKSRIANRVLLTAVMALVLGALLAVSSFAAIGLTEDGFLAGLTAGKTYTAAPYDIIAGTTGTAQAVDKTTDFDTLGSGIWAINDGTTTEYVFVKGTASGQLSYWDATNSAVLTGIAGDRNTKGLTAGKWTRGESGSYKLTPVTVDENGVAVVLGTTTTQKASLSLTELFYGFTKDQVIPANALTSWSFSIAFPTAYTEGYSAADLDGAVVFLVKAPGETEATEYAAALADKDAGAVTINAPAALANSNGYVVGICIRPWANWTDGANLYTSANLPATIVLNKGVNALAYTLKYATPDVEAASVTLNKETAALTVGDVIDLVATVLPENTTDKNVTWLSDSAAATVVNGKVTAVAAGTANITVTTVNGKTDICTVTITSEPALPNHEGLSVSLNGTVNGLEEGKSYTMQPYNVITGEKGAKSVLTATTVVDAGVWYVSNGEKGGYVFVAGAESGKMSFWDASANAPIGNIYGVSDTPVAGKWTRSADSAYSNIRSYANAAKTDVTVCIDLSKPMFLNKAEGATNYEGSTPIIGAENKLQESVVSYGFTAEQVVPANQVKDINFRSAILITGACQFNAGKTANDMKGTFTFIVKNPVNGDTEKYTVNTVGEQKAFTAPAAMKESAGYLVGFSYAPYANSADDLLVCNVNDYNAATGYAHIGLNPGENKINFENDLPAPTGIAVVDGKVTGLVEGAYYQYAPVTLGDNAALVVGTPATLDKNAKPEGLFVVRQTNASGTSYTAWTEDYLYIAGSSIHSIEHYTKVTGTAGSNSGKVIDVPVINNIGSPTTTAVTKDVFVPGAWSGFLINHELQKAYSFSTLRIGGTSGYLYSECSNYTTSTDETAKANYSKTITDVISNLYFSYGYEPDEIIEMKDWVSYKFTTAVRQTGAKVGTGAIKTKVTIFVVTEDGAVEERVALYDNVLSGSKTITMSQTDFADNSGYIVGIKIQPYFAPEGTTYIGASKTASDLNLQLIADTYKINLPKQPKPTGLYLENGVIKGLDATKEYAYAGMSVVGPTASTKVAAGATEITGLSGLVAVMTYGNGTSILNSDPVIFYIEGNADDRATLGTIEGGKPKYKTDTEWIPGTWTGSYLSWHDQDTGIPSYAFLDQTSGVAPSDAEKLWLYQVTKEEAQAKLNADAALAPPANWAASSVTSKPSRLQAVIDAHYAAADYDEKLAENLAAHKTKIATGLESRYIQYAYDASEIIPVSELVEMTFTSKSRQTDYKFDATPKTVFYVMDAEGEVSEYSVMGTKNTYTAGVWIRTKVDVQSIENWPSEGWVVAVKFYPLAEVDDETVKHDKTTFRSDASNIAFSFTQHHIAVGYAYTPYVGYVIKAKAPAPTFEVVANDAGAGYDVIITNASEVGNYEYKSATSDWTAVTGGKFTVAETGTYTVRVSGELFIGTAEADVVVEKLTPVAPTLNYEVNSSEDFKVTIANPSSLYTYEYKAEADADWTALDGNSFLAGVGKYEVRVSGAVWNGYATAEITTAKVAPVVPKVSVVPGEGADFTINIKNFSELYSYEYKLNDAADWTPVEAGAKSFVIYVGGEYTLRAGGTVYDGWAEVGFKAVEVPQEIKALSIDSKTGLLTGLVAEKAYEYALVNYAGISDTWTAIPAGTEYTFAEPGLYAIRLAAAGTEEASTPMVFSKLGSIADRGTIINMETKAYGSGVNWDKEIRALDVIKYTAYPDKTNPQFVVGRWSGWNIGDLQYWSKDWLTAVGRSSYEATSALGNKITDGSMSQDEAKEYIETFVFKYAYENSEIIPLADLEKFTVRSGHRQGHIYLKGGKVYTKFVFYIANAYGEIETRELLLDTNYSEVNKKNTHTVSAANFEDTDGYIVAIDVYPFAEISDDAVVTVSGTVGNDYEAKFIEYQVKLPRVPAPDYLTFNEETQLVEGLDPDVEYYYAPYTVNGVGETKYVSGEETLELPVGLWGVGVISDDPEYADSLPYIVFVRGEEAARKDLGARKPDGTYVTNTANEFMQGVWSGTGTATHSSFPTSGMSTLGGHVGGGLAKALKAAIDAEDAIAEAKARADIEAAAAAVSFKYAYDNDEVIPADELLNFKFKLSKRMGSLNLGEGVTAKVTFYVVTPSGDIETYTWEEATSTTSATSHNVDVYELLQGVEGYVVAIDVNPWTKVNGEKVVVLDGNNYNTMALFEVTGYDIKLAPAAPDLDTLEAPNAEGLGEVANLNSNMTYEYRAYDEETGEYGDWDVVKAGSTSVRLPAGKYEFRVAETREFTESEAVVVEILVSSVERKSLMNETKKIHLPNDFIEVTANYEIDTTSKIWIARLALDNIKTVAPDSTITITGDGYKYVVAAADLATDKMVHYYNLDLSFDGESRFDKTYDEIVELAGDAYIIEFFTESVNDLPFEAAELYIEVGSKYDGQEVELRAYNERIGKLRKTESATVDGGWVMFTNFGSTYVILTTEE